MVDEATTGLTPARPAVAAGAAALLASNTYRDPVDRQKFMENAQLGPGNGEFPAAARVADQNYLVIAVYPSHLAPDTRRVPLNFRGAFKTRVGAERYISEILYPTDPDFDHLIVPMYRWGMFPALDTELAQAKTVYHNPEIDEHMRVAFERVAKDRDELEQRKNDAVRAAREEIAAASASASATKEEETDGILDC